ncbi:SRPBCC family protein [Zhongshania aquimaris]|uniref:SRPBCC family protein n=1 Tax=Zhongshania aquimaris TaxID=2857107 RepID=A0ABS6VMV3_9GAMM|nr:SRPBCC family protein [Zhongshania aquimaris]MBW2939648.1 SRPBCC family protein [Zhongshania aquimaris]
MKHEAAARVVINMPREQAWSLLKDLSLAHNYVPGITHTEITTEKAEGPGASRRVFQSSGKGMDETIVEWNEGHGFLIRLHRGEKGAPPPFANAAFRYRLDDAGHNCTALTTSLMFDMRWGALGRFLHSRLLHKTFRGVIRDVAISMKQFYETGEPVKPEQLKQLRINARQAA